MWMIKELMSFLFPSRCIGCGTKDEALCASCISVARKSLSTPHAYIVSVFDFKDPIIRKVVHAIKYYHRRDIIPVIAVSLAEELKRSTIIHENTVVIPIPMHRSRYALRGYNHAEALAREVATLLTIAISTDTLIRIKKTTQQAKLHRRQERLVNQKGVFTVNGDIYGKDILLIDDVTTTGATLEEARNILIKAGAKRVHAGTIAH